MSNVIPFPMPGAATLPSVPTSGSALAAAGLPTSLPNVPGLSSVPGLSGLPSVPSAQDLTSLLAQNLDPSALEAITPEIKNAIGQGLAIAADAAPAYNLIDKIASGGTPNPQEVVAGMAGVATAVNPLAGAAVMAAGELAIGTEAAAEALLKGLGLISDQTKPVQYVGLIRKGSPIPSGGPGSPHPDPLWMTWDQFARVWYPPGASGTSTGWLPGALHPIAGEGAAPQGPASDVVQQVMNLLYHASPEYGKKPGSTVQTALVLHPKPANAFEQFLFPILMKDVENWANGNPYVDPRALFLAAVKTWNDKHKPASGVAHPMPTFTGVAAPIASLLEQTIQPLLAAGDVTYAPIEYGGASSPTDKNYLGMLLGSLGDSTGNGQRIGSVTVNMGAPIASPATAAGSAAGAPAAQTAAASTLIAQIRSGQARAAASAPPATSMRTAEVLAIVAAGAALLILLTRRST